MSYGDESFGDDDEEGGAPRPPREPRGAGSSTQKKPPKPITEKYLANVTKWYVERYRPSSGQLRRALMKRVERGLAHHGGDRDEAARWVDALVAKMQSLGAIDDAAAARGWAAMYHRRGVARRDIAGRLRAKGLSQPAIDAAMAELAASEGDPALAAACSYARRRRFGPFRLDAAQRKDKHQKDLAAMVRAGHSYDVARKVLACEDLDAFAELEERAGGE